MLPDDGAAGSGVIGWWASPDGATWAPLLSEGQVATSPRWDGGVAPDIVDLVDGTLVVLGQSGSDLLVWLAPLAPQRA